MRPFTLLIKPAGPDCNIACQYCFYTPKQQMFKPGRHRMSEKVLQRLVRDYMRLGFGVSSFAWQGGEPTLMGLDFFKRIVEFQKQYGKDGQVVSNALQTNGTLLDDQWCEFLAEYRFLVGISLDGPRHLHDFYRKDKAGQGSYDSVMRGIAACAKAGVDFNILALVNDKTVKRPDELWDFFVEQGFDFLQFVPCVEQEPERPGAAAAFAVDPDEFGDFICRIFDRWLEHGIRKVSVRLFDSMLNYLLSGRHTNCTFSDKCNDYIVVEHNGDAYCCDFFVTDHWRLGNIMEQPVEELFNSDRKKLFANCKRQLADKCIVCRFAQVCRGGCLKDRFALTGSYKQPSYLCSAYKKFFEHALGQLRVIADQVRAEQHSRQQQENKPVRKHRHRK